MRTALNAAYLRLRMPEHAVLLRTPPATSVTRLRGLKWPLVGIGVDTVMLVAAALAAGFGSRASGTPAQPLAGTVVFALLVLFFLRMRGVYSRRLRVQLLDELRSVATATALAAMAVLCVRQLLVGGPEIAGEVVRAWVFSTVYLGAGRVVVSRWQRSERTDGIGLRPTLIIGAGRIAQLTAARLLSSPEVGLKPIGFLDKDPLEGGDGAPQLPVLGASWDLERVVAEHGVEHAVVAFSRAPHEVMLSIATRCEALGVEVSFVPRLFERVTDRVSVEHLGGLPLITVRAANPKGWQFVVKHGVDRVVATILLVVAAPVLALSAAAIWRRMGRPIFFRQRRVGRDGRPFTMIKLRSMTLADGDEAPVVTPLGAVLRRLSIDELPQLLNVAKGQMSLVGPRPERPEYVSQFELDVYRYADRHRVKSGITGWAQVHGIGRGWDRFDGVLLAQRVEWDNYYIANWSPWLDVKILLMTVRAIFRFGQVDDSSSAPAPASPS